MNKECPEGKILNPLTRRCIKIKTEKLKKPKKNMQRVSMNQQIIDNLRIIQEYEKLNKSQIKVNAYEKVIENIELYDKEIEGIEDIKKINGIGKKIEEKILEFITTGKMHTVENILKDEKYILGKKLLGIYGIGPAKIEELMKKINIFDDIYQHQDLLNDKQLIGLKYYDDLQTRIPLVEAKKHYKIIQNTLGKDTIFDMVGSFRRKAKTIGDIDILIKDKDDGKFKLKEFINNLEAKGYVLETLASGKNKFMGICKISEDLPARRIDILVTEPKHYYFALLYFTGSYNFNIYMRRIALEKGLSLSEYGFKNNNTKEFIDTSETIKSEEDIFKYLEIPYVSPEKR